ncbi:MAG TPA: radical SAM protein [Campylobacterales bacterium]|nr:radical SAM protein [Campylobacterales bacterium]
MKSYIFNKIKNGETPFLKSTKQFLLKAQAQRINFRHAVAQKFPNTIKPNIEIVTIAITSKCNLGCQGCSYGKDFMPLEYLTLEQVKEILDNMKEMGLEHVWFYGGEPIMVHNEDLIEMVRYATKLGLISTLGTNGVMLTPKVMDELHAVGLGRLAIGLYGISETYNEYVQRVDAFEKLDQNISYIRKTYPKISLSLGWLLMKPTCTKEAVAELTTFAKKHQLRFSVNLVHYDFPYFTDGIKEDIQLYEEDLPEIKEVSEALRNFKKENPELLLTSFPALNAMGDWLIKKETIDIPCYRYNYLWIAANGEVRVCQKSALLGNVNEKSLTNILDTKEHVQSTRDCFALNCTGCHVGWDKRTTSTPKSRKQYSLA